MLNTGMPPVPEQGFGSAVPALPPSKYVCAILCCITQVWNKGTPPVPERDFDSAVPVRVRVERVNSLNNRFREDPLIRNR